MRSRSYYAIAGSSILLLLFYFVQKADDKVDAKVDDKADIKADAKVDAKVDVPGTDTGDEPHGFPEAGDGDEIGDPAPKPGDMPPLKSADGCRKGQMLFDGKCLLKDSVSKILDQRGEAALAKVRNANQTQQAVEAGYDLIEQQMYQVDKVEDDLDEIIEELKRENAERDGKGAP